jgi:hypothetical protein
MGMFFSSFISSISPFVNEITNKHIHWHFDKKARSG